MTINNIIVRATSALTLTCLLGGCATAAKDLSATYISPLQYQSFDCDQIAQESVRIQARATEIGGRLDEAAANDQGIAVAGAILFWPALFFLGGTKNQEAEYSRLKGEHDALQQQAIMKKCAPASALHTTQSELDVAPEKRELGQEISEPEPTRYKLVPQPI